MKRGQKYGRKNSNDGDDNQQFDEGKSTAGEWTRRSTFHDP
jgi:hypothetical protein